MVKVLPVQTRVQDMNVPDIKAARFSLLKTLYDLTGGSEFKGYDLFELGSRLGYDRELTGRIGQYLKGEALIAYHAMGPQIGITHDGVREVEDALSNPDQPTCHFPPINVISVQTMVNSVIQQGSPAGQQVVDQKLSDTAAVAGLLKDVRAALAELGLPATQRESLGADVATAEAQLSSPNAKPSIIGECLRSIRSVLEQAAGSLLAAGIIARINGMLAG